MGGWGEHTGSVQLWVLGGHVGESGGGKVDQAVNVKEVKRSGVGLLDLFGGRDEAVLLARVGVGLHQLFLSNCTIANLLSKDKSVVE